MNSCQGNIIAWWMLIQAIRWNLIAIIALRSRNKQLRFLTVKKLCFPSHNFSLVKFYLLFQNNKKKLMSRVFANGPGDNGSIPGRVIPKIKKMVFGPALLNTQHYKVRIKIMWSNPGNEVVPSPTPRCSSYWIGSFRVSTKVAKFTYL